MTWKHLISRSFFVTCGHHKTPDLMLVVGDVCSIIRPRPMTELHEPNCESSGSPNRQKSKKETKSYKTVCLRLRNRGRKPVCGFSGLHR